MTKPELSMLIPSILTCRSLFLQRILNQLEPQLSDGVDVSVLLESKTMIVGGARNTLMDVSRGDYLMFLDDDDRVSPEYVKETLEAIGDNPDVDVIVYGMIRTIDGEPPRRFMYGIEYEYKPTQFAVWRSGLASKHSCPLKSFQEDTDWTRSIWPHVKIQFRTPWVLDCSDMGRAYAKCREPDGHVLRHGLYGVTTSFMQLLVRGKGALHATDKAQPRLRWRTNRGQHRRGHCPG